MEGSEAIHLDPDEYFRLERSATTRHELWHGQRIRRPSGPYAHGRVITALAGQLEPQLRETCVFLTSEIKVVVPEINSYFYPDGSIACPPHVVDEVHGVIDNPTVLFEVLSPSTEAIDRGDKFRAYQSIPTLREYVLIDPLRHTLEVFVRRGADEWSYRRVVESTLALESVPAHLDLPTLFRPR